MAILEYSIVFFVTLAILSAFFTLKNNYKKFDSKVFMYILAGVLATIFFVRYMSGDDAIVDTFALESTMFSSKFINFVSLILNWILYANILLISIGTYFNNKTVRNIIKFFTLPTTVLIVVGLIPVINGIVGVHPEYSFDFNFRAVLMAVEIGMVLAYSIITLMTDGYYKTSKKELLGLLFIIPMLLCVMPPYIFKGLFGESPVNVLLKELSPTHRIFVYLSIILPIIIYFVLRGRSKSVVKLCLLYISIGGLLTFSLGFKFQDLMDVTHWPFHLCNTAMYIIPLCLIFKWEKLFYFTYFINVLGAFLAICMPNYSSTVGLFDTSVVVFYVNHYIAFFMPILMVSLKVYSRPNLRRFLYSVIGFAFYFILVLVVNAWFSNYGSVDYFFINSDFVADKLGKWAENLRLTTFEFTIKDLKFIFYPIYQTLYFLGYVLLGAGMWFLYTWCYEGADIFFDIIERRKKIKLDAIALQLAMEGRSVTEPMNKENTNKLILRNFSKRYGSNKHYAVKDANLEVHGGEIFGFLGPNGAGKSTIIKSIVGIQPITEGEIEICGYDAQKQSTQSRMEVGFVPDHYALYEKLTGREYINYIADLYKVSKEDRDKRINKYVKLFELEHSFDNQMRTYSHGMKQKIAIMSALVHNPKVWILDEPLTGLDPNSIFQVKECMKQHAKEGNIVFFSSHIIDVVERICDRIAIIRKGHILTCKSINEIEKETTLEKFYMDMINSPRQIENETNDINPIIEKTPKKKGKGVK